jgi:PTS system cellobiose-specific IIC component
MMKKQNKFMKWMQESFTPKMNKIVANPWVASVANTFTRILPFILTGSLIFFYDVFRSYISALPDLDVIKDFSFGFLSIFVVFFIPYNLMEKKSLNKFQVQAGLLGIVVYMLACNPTIDENSMMSIDYSQFGPTGLFNAIVLGLFTAFVYYSWTKHHFMENSTAIPDFVVDWLNNIAPITIALAIIMILVKILGIDLLGCLALVFSPIAAIGQTYIGFVLLCFIPAFLYSLGISSWAWGAVSTPIYMAGIAANIAAVAAGNPAVNIATSETVFTAALITLGGMGATLPLVILSIFKAKSKKLKTMGKICVGPSIFNINEPVVYGYPIAYNPTLMVPFWLNSIIGSTIVYCVMRFGLLNIPCQMIQVGQIPAPISSVMITQDWRAIIWWAVLWIVYTIIWLPFFKSYDAQCLLEEKEEAVAKDNEPETVNER